MDTSYKEVARLKAANGLEADLHEFRFTGTGTALITIYDVQQADLTQLGGSSHGYIWDSVFQEIDIETGELVFQWRASEHFAVTDSFHPRGNGGSKGNPWDWFHINSIEKDPWGNYLVSARYTSTVSYINGSTGELIWVLGGRPNQFFDLSEGRATDFKYQHDARWHENYTVISIFANGARAPGQQENTPYSSALKIRIDTSNTTRMTAQLDTQFINTLQISSSSQGSTQVLPNGNALVGYGYNAAFTEFASNGVALCETHFGATSRFHTGDVQSYRVLKFNWTGTPDTDPSLAVVSDSVFVSWNGATEVVGWVLETGEKRSGSEDIEWQVAAQNPKTSFETEIQLPEDRGSYIRVVAVDAEGRSLGITKVIQIAQVRCEYFDSMNIRANGYADFGHHQRRARRIQQLEGSQELSSASLHGVLHHPDMLRRHVLVADERHTAMVEGSEVQRLRRGPDAGSVNPLVSYHHAAYILTIISVSFVSVSIAASFSHSTSSSIAMISSAFGR